MADPTMHNQYGDPYRQRASRPNCDIDQSQTNIEHLKRCPVEFPEDFLDDPMPLAPTPKDPPQPSKIVHRQEEKKEILPNADKDFVDYCKKHAKIDDFYNSTWELDCFQNQVHMTEVYDLDDVWFGERKEKSPSPPIWDVPEQSNQQSTDQVKSPYSQEPEFEEEGNQKPMERFLYPVKTHVAHSQKMMNEVRTPWAEKAEKTEKVEKTVQRKKGPRARLPSIMSTTSSGETSSISPSYTYQPEEIDRLLKTPVDETKRIDTRAVCDHIICELKRLGIQQHLLAENVLDRTQGTLSDLLRNPRAWEDMKSGREPIRKMINWLKMCDAMKMDALKPRKKDDDVQVVFQSHGGVKRSSKFKDPSAPKRPRIIFTVYQKEVLDAAFEENREPSKTHQEVLAKQLDLEVKSVANYFTNARRRRNYKQRTVKEEVEDYYETSM